MIHKYKHMPSYSRKRRSNGRRHYRKRRSSRRSSRRSTRRTTKRSRDSRLRRRTSRKKQMVGGADTEPGFSHDDEYRVYVIKEDFSGNKSGRCRKLKHEGDSIVLYNDKNEEKEKIFLAQTKLKMKGDKHIECIDVETGYKYEIYVVDKCARNEKGWAGLEILPFRSLTNSDDIPEGQDDAKTSELYEKWDRQISIQTEIENERKLAEMYAYSGTGSWSTGPGAEHYEY